MVRPSLRRPYKLGEHDMLLPPHCCPKCVPVLLCDDGITRCQLPLPRLFHLLQTRQARQLHQALRRELVVTQVQISEPCKAANRLQASHALITIQLQLTLGQAQVLQLH
jgi:hypothetical protein